MSSTAISEAEPPPSVQSKNEFGKLKAVCGRGRGVVGVRQPYIYQDMSSTAISEAEPPPSVQSKNEFGKLKAVWGGGGW